MTLADFDRDGATDILVSRNHMRLTPEQQAKEDVFFKIETKACSRYGKILLRRELRVAHVAPDGTDDSVLSADSGEDRGGTDAIGECQEPPKHAPEFAATLYARSSGTYKGIRKIGDAVEEGTVIGQVTGADGSQTDVVSTVKGRLIGNAASNTDCKRNTELAAIDPSIDTKEECFQSIPVDKAVAYSILSLLKGKM